jgi:ABC-2 type transport system permease protein
MMEKKKYNQFTAMLAIARASFRSIIKNPSAVIFSILFPLIFIIVFGFIKGGSITLKVGVHPDTDTTSVLYKTFVQISNVQIDHKLSIDEMNEALTKGRIDAIINIHPATDNTMVAEIISSKATAEKSKFVKSILSNIIDKQNLAYMKARGYMDQSSVNNSTQVRPAEIRETEIAGRAYKMIDFILPGQLGFSILSAGVFGTAFIFFSLRQTLVLKRFFATPVRRTYIILGEAISRLLFQMIGSVIIIVLGKYIFGFTLIDGVVTAIQMLLLSALGLIVFMGFGFVISGIAKSESVIPPFANVITLPQFLLSGTFFPIEAFPGWLQSISKVLPLTYLNDALRIIAFEGGGLSAISTHLLIIFAWGVVIYAAAIRFFRWE